MPYLPPIVAMLVAAVVITVILRSKYGQAIQDIPNDRSLHNTPVPRTGGIALVLGLSAGWSFLAESIPWWVWLPCLMLFVVSLLDDIRNLPVKQRLFAHLTAAALLVAGSGVAAQQGWLVALAVFLYAAWMIDLYNFMDGSDGLAGGVALFGFACYGIASLLAHDEMLALLNFSIAAAALSFLFFNFHPARIFMGDAGSIPLGYLAAALGLWGWLRGDWSVWFPLLTFSPFIVDATVTLVKRTLRGAKITEAHREHYYQRAVQMGLGHRRVALVEYGLMSLIGLAALSSRNAAFPVLALLLSSGVLVLPMVWIERRWIMKETR
ncbi:MraY family glycosyltransferase [Ferrigenium sp. UT5]|uniref:MraY family glycosyltransferase n=1 Tax=Ferrigenium sp. UT5 TaxID=3242105 RepID=UPI0038B39D12